MTSEITCVLNVYKRVEYFDEQLNAILSQTIPPKRIIIWNNNPDINLSKYAKENIIILNSSQNLGVWPRFFSQYFLLSGEYVCIFDDDTIPGNNWFQNCVNTINKYNALLGTIGVIFKKGNIYDFKTRFGWDGGCEDAKMVDIVGHSWFFRKEWVSTLIKELPNINETFLTCGEDIHLSYVLQKYLNIPTIVPPHPLNNRSLWGADTDKSWKYGVDINAVSCQPGYHLRFTDAFKNYIDKGFETIHNKAESLKIYSNCLEYFINRIKNKQHFAIMKCADGEYSVSINKSMQNIDDWTFKTDSILNKHFNNSLTLINSNVFYGISGPSDSKEICDYWYKNIPNTHNITYANIFVNKNYSIWQNFLKNSDYNCVLISQIYPLNGKLGGMKIIDYLSIDNYLVNKWDAEYENYFELVSKLARNHTNVLFFVSAGPLANIFIHRMYLENPNNTYIDCGSSIDFLTKGIYTRTYQTDSNVYIDKENLPVIYTDLNIIKSKDILNDKYLYKLKKNFENIYKNNTWNMGQTESKSGLGSTFTYTEYIRQSLVNFIKEKNIKNMLDTSCGDWNWMKMVKNDICSYVGIDIVQDIINVNNELYSSDKIKFLNIDFLTYIKGQSDNSIDLIFCRHTLEHLPTDYNIEFLKECKRVCKYLLVTTYNNNNIQNKEIITDYRPVNLKLEPYLNVIDDFYQTEFYDGPSDIYHPECFMNVYNFTVITQFQKDFAMTFQGGWSYTPKEISQLLKNLSFKEDYSVLEFGSGDSTIKLHNYIKNYTTNLTFYTYESNIEYIKDHDEIHYILYDINNIKDIIFPDIKFDLVLIDGPNGDKRAKWYSKIRNNVKTGTILLVDDFNHYTAFSEELDNNFEYETLSYSNEPFVVNGEHSWKIVKIIACR